MYSFDDHPEHRAQLSAHCDRWIANAFSTAPADPDVTREAVVGMYRAAKLDPPIVVHAASPMAAAIAGSIAAGAWWIRGNPDRHPALFGRVVSEAELMGAADAACRIAVTTGISSLRGLPPSGRPAADDATRPAADAATRDAAHAVTYVDTVASTRAAIDDATYAVVDDATRDASRDATVDAISVVANAATRVAIAATLATTACSAPRRAPEVTGIPDVGVRLYATDIETNLTIADSTRDAIDDATYVVVDDSTRVAIDDATYVATSGSTYGSTSAMTDAANVQSVRGAADPLVRFLLGCTHYWYRMYQGGSDCSGWPAYLSFFRHVAKLGIDYSAWQHYETLALQSGGRMMHSRFCIVADRQTSIYVDAENRLHNETGPARTWSDGWKLWYWHGIMVPEWVITNPTVAAIQAEPNTEIRRAAIESMGWPKFIEQAGLKLVASVPDPGNAPHELRLYDVPSRMFDTPVRVLVMTNGSPDRSGELRQYAETVPEHFGDPVHAAAWQYRVPSEVYRKLQRRT